MATMFNAGGGWYNPFNAPQAPSFQPSMPSIQNLMPNMNCSNYPPLYQPALRRNNRQIYNDEADFSNQVDSTRQHKFMAGESAGKENQISSLFRYKLQLWGVILCILAAFCFGVAISNVLVLVMSYGDLLCLTISPVLPIPSPVAPLSYFIHVTPNIPPAFIFIVSIFCLVLRDPKGTLIKYLFLLILINIVIIVPIYLIFGILGVLHAVRCGSGVIQIMKLTLPILIAVFGLLLHLILIYLATVVYSIRKTYNSGSSSQSPQPSQPSRAFNGFVNNDRGMPDSNAPPQQNFNPSQLPPFNPNQPDFPPSQNFNPLKSSMLQQSNNRLPSFGMSKFNPTSSPISGFTPGLSKYLNY